MIKKVCVLKREENTSEENQLYLEAIRRFGADPIFIDHDNIDQLKECSGIVITGGFDKGDLDDYLISYALEKNLPLLGICQGMQSMAMYQSDLKLEKIPNHHKGEGYIHAVYLEESHLKDMMKKDQIMVNSYHYQTVRDSKVFSIIGRSDDGYIEAIENKNHPFQIGVQWHPERMIPYDEDSVKLFQCFIDCLSNT